MVRPPLCGLLIMSNETRHSGHPRTCRWLDPVAEGDVPWIVHALLVQPLDVYLMN
jgi:hypothetical protein